MRYLVSYLFLFWTPSEIAPSTQTEHLTLQLINPIHCPIRCDFSAFDTEDLWGDPPTLTAHLSFPWARIHILGLESLVAFTHTCLSLWFLYLHMTLPHTSLWSPHGHLIDSRNCVWSPPRVCLLCILWRITYVQESRWSIPGVHQESQEWWTWWIFGVTKIQCLWELL